MNNQDRPGWDEYFMMITKVVATRSTCIRRRVGAVIVKDRQILATGYNGAPKGVEHCVDRGCLRDSLSIPSGQRHELCRGLHAEQNAIIQAAFNGVSIAGGSIYITNQPCYICAKMIVNAGLKRVVYSGKYPDDFSVKLFEEVGMQVDIYESYISSEQSTE